MILSAVNGGFVPAADDNTLPLFRPEGTSPLSRKRIRVRPEEKGRARDLRTDVPLSALPHRNATYR